MSSSEGSSRRPAATAFKQQQLKACQPILTPLPVITSFLVIGIVFIPLGVVLLVSSNQVVEVSLRYDNNELCDLNMTCVITLEIPEKMEAPVFFYYGLDNFYQNHRRYVKSRNDDQLRGVVVDSYSALEDCEPLRSEDGSKDADNFFLPCGLVAASMFNDTFRLEKSDGVITLRKDGIAWKSDVEKKFKNPPEDAPGIRIIDNFTDPDFIVWMRTAGLPNFRKLYGIIDTDIEPGTVNITIENNFPVADFDGKKRVILSTASWLGGKNPFLGYAYIIVGIICFIQGVAFGIKHRLAPRKLGDTKYLRWNK